MINEFDYERHHDDLMSRAYHAADSELDGRSDWALYVELVLESPTVDAYVRALLRGRKCNPMVRDLIKLEAARLRWSHGERAHARGEDYTDGKPWVRVPGSFGSGSR